MKFDHCLLAISSQASSNYFHLTVFCLAGAHNVEFMWICTSRIWAVWRRCTPIFFADLVDFKDDHGDGAEPTALESKVNTAWRRLSEQSPNPGSLVLCFLLLETFSGKLREVFWIWQSHNELTFFYCGSSIRMLWTMTDARVSTEASIGGVLCKDWSCCFRCMY